MLVRNYINEPFNFQYRRILMLQNDINIFSVSIHRTLHSTTSQFPSRLQSALDRIFVQHQRGFGKETSHDEML